MPEPVAGALVIGLFDRTQHDRSAFSCGHGPIDNFLKSSLSDQIKAGLIAAYMATEPGSPAVLGFYTLGAHAVRADHGPARWSASRVPDVPVIYLRAVAVHRDRQGSGLGTALVVDALRRCHAIAAQIGAAAVVLDVLADDQTDRRLAFYHRLGFRALNDPLNPTRLFLAMADIRATLGG